MIIMQAIVGCCECRVYKLPALERQTPGSLLSFFLFYTFPLREESVQSTNSRQRVKKKLLLLLLFSGH